MFLAEGEMRVCQLVVVRQEGEMASLRQVGETSCSLDVVGQRLHSFDVLHDIEEVEVLPSVDAGQGVTMLVVHIAFEEAVID